MKKTILISFSALFLVGALFGQQAKGLKVLISVDMEGITGIVSADECNRRASDDYQYFRKIMTLEANAALSLHPEVSGQLIKEGVERALRNLGKYKPYRLTAPYKFVLTLKDEKMVDNGQYYPGAKRTGDWELTYESKDLMEVLKAFSGMQKE
jgi:D-amino peptidase